MNRLFAQGPQATLAGTDRSGGLEHSLAGRSSQSTRFTSDPLREPQGPRPLRLTTPHRSRKPLGIAISLAVLATSMAVVAVSYLHATRRESVLVVTEPVALGTRINASELGVIKISSSARLSVISAAEESQVLGLTARTPLVRGSLLTRNELGSILSWLPQGYAMVGVQLAPGELPAYGLEDGQTVMVILTAGSSGSGTLRGESQQPGLSQPGAAERVSPQDIPYYGSSFTGSVLVPSARVLQVGPAPDASTGELNQVVSLAVPVTLAPLVATAAIAGQVSLALVVPS